MASITLTFFGKHLPKAEQFANRKFRDCPWPYFDGVPDPYPDQLLASDLAVTMVMGSGISSTHIWGKSHEKLWRNDTVNSLLEAIPKTMELECTSEQNEEVPWSTIDRLFEQMQGFRFRQSRIAKVLCRKRPGLIPMLDSIVVGFLQGAAKTWRRSGSGPEWFPLAWDKWASWQVPSPYIRMIRHDMQHQVDVLKELRTRLVAEKETKVPIDAPLLRIYEATLFRAISEGEV